jgi:two-component system, OmpR family, sensor histidine kinase KdpD
MLSALPLRPDMRSGLAGGLAAFVVVAACSLIGLPLREAEWAGNVPLIYLVGVVVTAAWRGIGPAVLASVLGVLAYNFLFTRPYFTLHVDDGRHLFTFALMLVTSLLVGTLTARVSRHARQAERNETETRRLYDLAKTLAALGSAAEIAAETSRQVADLYGAAAIVRHGCDIDGDAGAIIREAQLSDGLLAARDIGGVFYVPMAAQGEIQGVLEVRDGHTAGLSPQARARFESLAALVAVALRRSRLTEQAEKVRLDAENERLRSVLLASVSHDLRTPLAVLKSGLGQLLRNRKRLPRDSVEEITGLLLHLDRLQRFVENLLRLAALTSGRLKLNREPYMIQEILGAAMVRVTAVKETRNVRTVVTGILPLVDIDGALIEQVLFNLFDNAIRHTAPDGIITISAERDGQGVKVAIADNGPGLPNGVALFEQFQAGQHERSDRAGKTNGLGLAICRGIVEAHGGTISAETITTAAGLPAGARFTFTLPAAISQ